MFTEKRHVTVRTEQNRTCHLIAFKNGKPEVSKHKYSELQNQITFANLNTTEAITQG